ncbi:Lim/Homeobox Protein Lhx2, partial [Manis pentadactyla]
MFFVCVVCFRCCLGFVGSLFVVVAADVQYYLCKDFSVCLPCGVPCVLECFVLCLCRCVLYTLSNGFCVFVVLVCSICVFVFLVDTCWGVWGLYCVGVIRG